MTKFNEMAGMLLAAQGRQHMRNAIEGVSVGYGVTYLGAILAGFPWDKLASAFTFLWFATLLIEKIWKKVKELRQSRSGP